MIVNEQRHQHGGQSIGLSLPAAGEMNKALAISPRASLSRRASHPDLRSGHRQAKRAVGEGGGGGGQLKAEGGFSVCLSDYVSVCLSVCLSDYVSV